MFNQVSYLVSLKELLCMDSRMCVLMLLLLPHGLYRHRLFNLLLTVNQAWANSGHNLILHLLRRGVAPYKCLHGRLTRIYQLLQLTVELTDSCLISVDLCVPLLHHYLICDGQFSLLQRTQLNGHCLAIRHRNDITLRMVISSIRRPSVLVNSSLLIRPIMVDDRIQLIDLSNCSLLHLFSRCQ
jgi:hypothetical protein